MDPFILNDLLRRVASGRTTAADADFLEDCWGGAGGWLNPRVCRPGGGCLALVVFEATPGHAEVVTCRYTSPASVEICGAILTEWSDPRILLWRPGPEPPPRLLVSSRGHARPPGQARAGGGQ